MPPKHQAAALAVLSAPVAVGAWVMLLKGAPASRWVVQAALIPLGLCAWWVARWVALRVTASAAPAEAAPEGASAWARWRGWAMAGGAVALVAVTLGAEGIEGVRRWLPLGPLRLHASALVAPALLVWIARRADEAPGRVAAVVLALQCVHTLQPDAGQATAWAVAAALTLLKRPLTSERAAGALGAAALCAMAWARPDPLEAAPFVEDVLPRALSHSAALWALAAASLLGALAAPALVGLRDDVAPSARAAAAALCAYLTGAIVASMWAFFPVPLLGFSPSVTVGAFAALGALSAAASMGQRD